MLYIDTCVLVAALTSEANTMRMQDWLSNQVPEELTISHLTITEFSSALALKLRTQQLKIGERNEALAAFDRLVTDSFNTIAITTSHFRMAARLADQYLLGLRTGDALHLAITVEHRATVCTLDRRLAEAGETLGAKTKLL